MRFNQVLTEEINDKVLKTLIVHKPLFSEHESSINQVKIILKLTKKQINLNRVKPTIEKTLSPEIENLFYWINLCLFLDLAYLILILLR